MLYPSPLSRFAKGRAAIRLARRALPAFMHSLAFAALTLATSTAATAATAATGATAVQAGITTLASAAATAVQPGLTSASAATTTTTTTTTDTTTANLTIAPALAVATTGPAPAIQLAAATGKPARSGASIYSVSCASCHTYGMRGAPKLTDKAAWAPRLAQQPGTLVTHVIKGLGWMPPRGTCTTCSDEDIKAAVDYMVSRLPAP